jgi:hypothetical protein
MSEKIQFGFAFIEHDRLTSLYKITTADLFFATHTIINLACTVCGEIIDKGLLAENTEAEVTYGKNKICLLCGTFYICSRCLKKGHIHEQLAQKPAYEQDEHFAEHRCLMLSLINHLQVPKWDTEYERRSQAFLQAYALIAADATACLGVEYEAIVPGEFND